MKAVRAILISPLVAVPVVAVIAMIAAGARIGVAWWVLYACVFIVPASYIGLVALGIPYAFLLRRSGTIHPVPLALGAILAGAATGYAAARYLLDPTNAIGIIAFTAMGAFSAKAVVLTHWWLSGAAAEFRTRPVVPVHVEPPRPAWRPTFSSAAYFVACVAVLLYFFWQRDVMDSDGTLLWLMVALTFPSGLFFAMLVGFALSAASKQFGFEAPGGMVAVVVAWALFVAVGYLQWFVLIPRMKRDRKRLREKRASETR